MSKADTGASQSNESSPNYKLCCLFDKNKNVCGPFVRNRTPLHGLVEVGKLDACTEAHFRALQLSFRESKCEWTERGLVENRLGRRLHDSDKICQNHRQRLGIFWSQTKNCAHPSHPYKRGTKSPATLLAPIWLVEQMKDEVEPFPLGGRCCDKHWKIEKSKRKTEKKIEEDNQYEAQDESTDDATDTTYEPDVPYCPPDVQSSSKQIGNQIAQCLDLSPLTVQVTKTPIRDLSYKLKQTIKRKIDEATDRVVERIAESVAPTQASELIDELYGSRDIPTDLEPLIDPYALSDSRSKSIILSLVNHEIHSKSVIQNIFGCSKYSVEKARKLQPSVKGLIVPTKSIFHRNRLNIQKCEHFLEFLFSSGLLQDVAYGVSRIAFDSGQKQTIPHAILTAKYSHVIAFYLAVCRQTGFEPVSESSLWRILRALKPSQRKSLAGLDDITADGMNAFKYLETFLQRLKKDKDLIDRLEKGKRYLKISYQSHCSMESEIKSHNAVFALSTEKEVPCVQVSDRVCSDCYQLISILDTVSQISKKEGTDDEIYDVQQSIESVIRYMKHQMRDHQQRKAKAYCFENLNPQTAFWLKDFAQKVIPIRYREGQREYFGKKGMSLHIDVFFRQDHDNLLKYVYMTCLYRCKQSMVDVLNIADNVLNTFRIDCPMINKLFAKSDNAGCYHGNYVMEALYKICLSKSLTLLRYDYNEPCKGKDQCDRESAGAKSVINSFVNSGSDLVSANDLHDALHYGKGIRNTQACVLEVDLEQSTLQGLTIKGISSFHSVEFFEKYMKLQRYYNIGPGVVVNYSDQSKFVPSYVQVKEFNHTQSEVVHEPCSQQKRRLDHQLCTLIFCENPLCTDVFETLTEYENHLLSEKHTITNQDSTLDKVRTSYVTKMKVASQKHSSSTSTESEIATITLPESLVTCPLMKEISEQGWALPHRSNFVYSYEQKVLLYDIFIEGEKTNKKSHQWKRRCSSGRI